MTSLAPGAGPGKIQRGIVTITDSALSIRPACNGVYGNIGCLLAVDNCKAIAEIDAACDDFILRRCVSRSRRRDNGDFIDPFQFF
jgi:hypothetical protein